MNAPAPSPRLYLAGPAYYQGLLASINAAKQHILLETMVLDNAGEMSAVLEACLRARARDVAVTIVFDVFAYWELFFKQGFGGLPTFRSRLYELRRHGAAISIVGARQLNPFAGRHHAKAVIVDATVYIGGGVNLTGESFQTHDFMLRYDSAEMAACLYEALPTEALLRVADVTLWMNDTTKILLDAGQKGQSRIYETVCQLATSATKVWYVSKLAPDWRLARILKGTQTLYWYNTVSSADLFSKAAIYLDQKKFRVANGYRGRRLLHAKFCVFEQPDGRLSAIAGSHNFNSRGINFGTQEVAVCSTDRLLCQELIKFAESLSEAL